MPAEALDTTDDIAFVDRRSVRTAASIGGRYSIANKRNLRAERREFACRTISISADAVVLIGPVRGTVGERVIAHFAELGKLEGQIVRLEPTGSS